jgi:hypothetical protein
MKDWLLLGALAQLVEHLLCKQRVNGSSPLSSTKIVPCEHELFFDITEANSINCKFLGELINFPVKSENTHQ